MAEQFHFSFVRKLSKVRWQ